MNSIELAKLAAAAIDEKKGYGIRILELKDISVITDYFIIASGNSRVQTQAIADNVEENMAKVGIKTGRREGYPEGKWILLDFGAVIVHIFQDEERNFYNLERIWGDAPQIEFQD